jgi:glycosyltransferase involved in cell wall biosynthesis
MASARRLRIASIYSSLIVGGDTTRLLAYLAARDRDRFDHIVFGGMRSSLEWENLSGPMWERFRALDVEIVDIGIPVRHLHWKRASRLNRTAGQFRTYSELVYRIARKLRERKVDIVDGRMEMGTVLAALAGRLAGVKAVVSTKYTPWSGGERWFRKRAPLLWSILGHGTYMLVDAVVCDSATCLRDIRQGLRWPPAGYCVPNGIERPRVERPREELKRELGIPSGAKVVAQVGRLRPSKGQDLFLKAAPVILAQHPEAFFLVVGYAGHTKVATDYRTHLDQLITNLGIQNRVRIVSYPGTIGDIWSVVDIHAHPTRLDSSPISLLESMSFAVPAVTTRIGGIPDVVISGETGIILPPEDAPSLADAIVRLLRDPHEATRLGRNARQRYESFYTADVMARRLEDMFEQVYAGRRFRGV